MRRFFKWLGIAIGGLLALVLAAAFWFAGGPQEIWGELFPEQFYDNVEVKLVIDGEAVTVTGTAFCSISRRSMPIIAYRGSTVTRTGGAAVTVMSDGRAVVIPYSNLEYCHGLEAPDGFPDQDYKNWWSVFDQRFSLKGNIDILIMDDGDNPSEMELLDGPGYFRNSEASIKLISADRWRSKTGEETSSDLAWLRSEEVRTHEEAKSRQWIGAFVYVIAQYQNDQAYIQIQRIMDAKDETDVRRLIGPLRKYVRQSSVVQAWAVELVGQTAELASGLEPFRIRLSRMLIRGHTAAFSNQQTVVAKPDCYGVSAPWSLGEQPNFLRLGKNANINSIAQTSFLFSDSDTISFLFANTICVDPRLFQ